MAARRSGGPSVVRTAQGRRKTKEMTCVRQGVRQCRSSLWCGCRSSLWCGCPANRLSRRRNGMPLWHAAVVCCCCLLLLFAQGKDSLAAMYIRPRREWAAQKTGAEEHSPSDSAVPPMTGCLTAAAIRRHLQQTRCTCLSGSDGRSCLAAGTESQAELTVNGSDVSPAGVDHPIAGICDTGHTPVISRDQRDDMRQG